MTDYDVLDMGGTGAISVPTPPDLSRQMTVE